jgi:hypothetical protein
MPCASFNGMRRRANVRERFNSMQRALPFRQRKLRKTIIVTKKTAF